MQHRAGVDFASGALSFKQGLILDVGAVQEKRETYRKRVLKNAQIILSEKAPKLECAVRNLTQTGACLQVSTTYGIPVNFEVVVEGVRRPCRSVWRTDTKLGVTFA